MGKATINDLNILHDLTARYYKDLLSGEDGVTERLSSGELTALNSFLKTNNITADISESNELQDLTAEFRKRIKIEKEA